MPPLRVFNEGVYGAESTMICYGLPGRFAPCVEEAMSREVHELREIEGRRQREAANELGSN